MLTLLEIKKALATLVSETIEQAEIYADEDACMLQNSNRPVYIELVPQLFSSGKYVERVVNVFIRFHEQNTTPLSRLATYEKMVVALSKPISIEDRFILADTIGYEEINKVLEVKCSLRFNDGYNEAIQNEIMATLEFKGGI